MEYSYAGGFSFSWFVMKWKVFEDSRESWVTAKAVRVGK